MQQLTVTEQRKDFFTQEIKTVNFFGTVETAYKVNRREWKRLKGCVFSPPSVRPVPARGREARKPFNHFHSHPGTSWKQ